MTDVHSPSSFIYYFEQKHFQHFNPTWTGAQCFFFGNFGSEIQIGNQQVWGKNWVLKVVIHKFSVMNFAKKGPKFQV